MTHAVKELQLCTPARHPQVPAQAHNAATHCRCIAVRCGTTVSFWVRVFRLRVYPYKNGRAR